MKTLFLAAAALSLSLGVAYAGDGDGSPATTLFTSLPSQQSIPMAQLRAAKSGGMAAHSHHQAEGSNGTAVPGNAKAG